MPIKENIEDLRVVAVSAASEALRRFCENPEALLPEYLATKQLATYIGVNPTTLEMWRASGKGPPHTRIGRFVRYRRADVDEWMASNRVAKREDS